jgi:hypothetical protein
MRFTSFLLIALLTAGSAIFGADFDRSLLNLVPSGAQVVAGVQIDEGKASAFGQYVLQRSAQDAPDLQKLIDSTGFDPRRDLQQVLLAGWAGKDPSHHSGLVIARGVFDTARIKQAALAQGGHTEAFQGFDLLSGKNNSSDCFAFLDSTLAVLGDRAAVQSVIMNRNTPTTLDAQLEKRVESVITGNEVWFASVMPGTQLPFAQSHGRDNNQMNAAAIQAIVQSSGGVHFAADAVQVAFDALTRSEKDAQSLTDVVRFFASMIQMQRQNQSQAALLAPVFDQMQLTTGGNTVHIALSVPETTVEQLINEPHKRHAAGTMRGR